MSGTVAPNPALDKQLFAVNGSKQAQGDYHEWVKSIANGRITQLLLDGSRAALLEVTRIRWHVDYLMSLTWQEARQYLDANPEVAEMIWIRSED